MKQWFLTSVADNLLTTGGKYIKKDIKKQEGSLDYYILTQWFHIFILFFYNVFWLVSSNGTGNSNAVMILLTCLSGGISGLSNIVYFHQRETNYLNLYNINVILVMCLDLMLTNSYNIMSIGGTTFIIFGVLLIDSTNYDKWFINKNYWKNLDTRLMLHEDIMNMYQDDDNTRNLEEGLLYQETHRTYTKQHLMLIPIILTNISDLLLKYSFHSFYTGYPKDTTIHINLVNQTNTTSLYLKSLPYIIVFQGSFYFILFKQITYVCFMNINNISYDVKLFYSTKFFYNAGITLVNSLVYYYVIIVSPNIGYGKAILLSNKFFNCLIQNENTHIDVALMGSLFIFCGSVAMYPNYILF